MLVAYSVDGGVEEGDGGVGGGGGGMGGMGGMGMGGNRYALVCICHMPYNPPLYATNMY
jgi:hypothetical protein